MAGDRVAAWAVARSVVGGVTTAARAEGHSVEGTSLTFHGFPFVTQLAAGSLDDVTGSVERATLGGHEVTDVSFRAYDVQAREPWRTQRAELDGLVTFATVSAVLAEQLGTDVVLAPAPGEPDGVLLTGSVLGLDVGAVVVPAVGDASTVEVQVRTVSIAGVTVGADAIPGGLGERLGGLSFPLELPDGVALSSVAVEAGGLRTGLLAHDVALSQLAS